MIENDQQLKITQTWIVRFEESLETLKATPRPNDIHPKLWKAEQEATLSTLEELREQVHPHLRIHHRSVIFPPPPFTSDNVFDSAGEVIKFEQPIEQKVKVSFLQVEHH
jgi:hypothetical protein